MGRVDAFLAWERVRTRLVRGAGSVVAGAWLGLLDHDDLVVATSRAYDCWDQYQSAAHNLSGLRDWERQAVDAWFQGRRSVIVAAAGGGREAIALAELGLSVQAFECAPVLRDEAQRLTSSADVRVLAAEPSEVPHDLDPADAAIVGWGGYMHIPGRDRRVAFLRGLRVLLPADGPLLVSFFLRGDDARSFAIVRRVAMLVRRARRSRDRVELGDHLDRTFDHWFTREEIEREVVDAGFDVVHFASTPYPHLVACVAER